MSTRWVFVAERLVEAALGELRRHHWLPMFGGTAGAYLFYFFADVYLQLNKPAALIVFI